MVDSTPTHLNSVVQEFNRPVLAAQLPMLRKKPSAFCGEYINSTRIGEQGVLGNECFINGLSFVPNIFFVLIAVPVLISWNKSIFASMHVKTWVRFPHHTLRWILVFFLLITSIFEVHYDVFGCSLDCLSH